MPKRQNRNVMHNDAGKKIQHPADVIRKKAKKRRVEKVKKERMGNFEKKMLERSPEDIQSEIQSLKYDIERKEKAKVDVPKYVRDKLNRLEVGFARMKDKVEEKHQKRLAEPKSSMHVDFEELKIHRKSSVFYHPVMNPYGAPPTGQTLMYRHPDGSVKREPPPEAVSGPSDAMDLGGGDPAAGSDASGSDDDSEEYDDGLDDDQDEEPPLPAEMPWEIGPAVPSLPSNAGAPLPPGLPPLPAGLPPLPPGLPPLPGGLPPLPPGGPPGPGLPPLPPGLPPLPTGGPPGLPPMPPGGPPGPMAALGFGSGFASPGVSQADFMAQLAKAGFQIPGGSGPLRPPGPPPGMAPERTPVVPLVPPGMKPPGPPPKTSARTPEPSEAPAKRAPVTAAQPSVQSEIPVVNELPKGAKAPPPPPKKASAATGGSAGGFRLQAAMAFTPTSLRTKRPSQVAGGVLQVSSSSLSQEKRKAVVSQDVPRVAEAVSVDDAFATFLQELDAE